MHACYYDVQQHVTRMVTDIISQLEEAKARVSEIEANLAKQRESRLPTLHREFGFETAEELIAALRIMGGKKGRGRPVVTTSPRRGKRARITPEMKQQLKSLVEEGKTGQQIAKELGISLPSVQNIKKEFGLVKSRGKK